MNLYAGITKKRLVGSIDLTKLKDVRNVGILHVCTADGIEVGWISKDVLFLDKDLEKPTKGDY